MTKATQQTRAILNCSKKSRFQIGIFWSLLPLVLAAMGCSNTFLRENNRAEILPIGRTSSSNVRAVYRHQQSSGNPSQKSRLSTVDRSPLPHTVTVAPSAIPDEFVPTEAPDPCASCVPVDAVHERHCQCGDCCGPCDGAGVHPLSMLAAKSKCSFDVLVAKLQYRKEQLRDSLHCKTAIVHDHVHESRLAKWAAKKREEANSPPWPRFHPLPTRNVFYPECPDERQDEGPAPTEQYGQFGVLEK